MLQRLSWEKLLGRSGTVAFNSSANASRRRLSASTDSADANRLDFVGDLPAPADCPSYPRSHRTTIPLRHREWRSVPRATRRPKAVLKDCGQDTRRYSPKSQPAVVTVSEQRFPNLSQLLDRLLGLSLDHLAEPAIGSDPFRLFQRMRGIVDLCGIGFEGTNCDRFSVARSARGLDDQRKCQRHSRLDRVSYRLHSCFEGHGGPLDLKRILRPPNTPAKSVRRWSTSGDADRVTRFVLVHFDAVIILAPLRGARYHGRSLFRTGFYFPLCEHLRRGEISGVEVGELLQQLWVRYFDRTAFA